MKGQSSPGANWLCDERHGIREKRPLLLMIEESLKRVLSPKANARARRRALRAAAAARKALRELKDVA